MTEATVEYKVKTAAFEGPLEALLRLVEERKLFINEISLAEVTDDYIKYVKGLTGYDMGQISGFLVVAATLILIKSRSLLPSLELTEEEHEQIGDLERRLRLYQLIKDIGVEIKTKFGKQIIFSPLERNDFAPVFSPDKNITLEKMLEAANAALLNIPKKEFMPEVEVKKVMSLEEMIGNLTDRIAQNLRFNLRDLSRGQKFETKREEKIFTIVSFLATLELIRTGILDVIQENRFSEIEIRKNEIEVIGN